MQTTDKLIRLISLCKCSVTVTVNDHRGVYLPVGAAIEDYLVTEQMHDDETPKEVRDRMIELDTVVSVQFYPHTSVGSYTVWHHDLDLALDEALGTFGESK